MGVTIQTSWFSFCLLWHVPNNVSHPHGDPLRDVCPECKRLASDIQQLVKNALNVSDGKKLQRLTPSSNYPISYLSPKSKAIRFERVTKSANVNTKLSRLAEFDFDVDEMQHNELLTMVGSVNRSGSKAIEELCSRGDELLGEGKNLLKEAWRQDVIERLEYEKSKSGICILIANF